MKLTLVPVGNNIFHAVHDGTSIFRVYPFPGSAMKYGATFLNHESCVATGITKKELVAKLEDLYTKLNGCHV